MLFQKKKETLDVGGMNCGHCEETVEKGLGGLPGVSKVQADHKKGRVDVFYKGDPPDMEAVKKKVVEMGYEVA